MQMAKVKLCANDESALVSELIAVGNALENLGVEGVAAIAFDTNGNISGTFSINEETNLLVSIESDGNKKTLEYKYV